MHEDLLGYLLGALEPHEMERVAAMLKQDPEARHQLAELQRSLRPLEEYYEPGEAPPLDLVARTLHEIPELPAFDSPWSLADPVEPIAPVNLPSMRSSDYRPQSRSFTWLDMAALSAAAAVVLALLVPAMSHSRFEARRAACQDQLRGLGIAITSYVNRNEQQRLPAVSQSGPEAFAGVYAVRLSDAGLLEDDNARWCPSLDAPGDDQLRFAELNKLPTTKQLHHSSADRLRQFQKFAGGHYAYTLGVVDKNHFESPRFESRASFAVMSDAPMAGIPSQANFRESIGHDGRGINVLYEDGRVRFVSVKSLGVMPDHPLFNHRGQVEAGVNVDDASLAPSWRPPFVDVPQR
jgi:hypothetical protein